MKFASAISGHALVLAFALAGVCRPAAAATTERAIAAVPTGDTVVARMFAWWNEQMRERRPFTTSGFAQFFASDAILRIDGVQTAAGIEAVTAHFAAIQASGAQVEIVLPFIEAFATQHNEYTYHVIRSRRNGQPRCMLAAGHTVLDHGRIKEISLVRAVVQPGSSPAAKACWAE